MPKHSKATIVALAVMASVIGSMLHEGLGHGVTAWLRGDRVTEWTSNHLDDVRPDRLVDAGGTLVNLIAGLICLGAARVARARANLRYFLWLLAALNLLLGAGYFLFSGVLGLGDWAQVVAGLPHPGALRTAMAATGALLYVVFLRWIVIGLRPFCPSRGEYNTVGRLPYYASCIYMCTAGALDPLGFKLMLLSSIPAFFGGLSGLLWGDVFLRGQRQPAEVLTVRRSGGTWIAAVVVAVAFLATVARGIEFRY
ncbi:MAG TPA: hypothetical protein VMD29_11895 [Terracidiphilus sp.]|nr:hypothetical protein [Terracidiphilus sp.]